MIAAMICQKGTRHYWVLRDGDRDLARGPMVGSNTEAIASFGAAQQAMRNANVVVTVNEDNLPPAARLGTSRWRPLDEQGQAIPGAVVETDQPLTGADNEEAETGPPEYEVVGDQILGAFDKTQGVAPDA